MSFAIACGHCGTGTYEDDTGHLNDACKHCGDGSTTANKVVCATCDAGQFEEKDDVAGRFTCKACPADYYDDGSEDTLTACKACGAGSVTADKIGCAACPSGRFEDATTFACANCPAHWHAGAGEDACEASTQTCNTGEDCGQNPFAHTKEHPHSDNKGKSPNKERGYQEWPDRQNYHSCNEPT